MPRPACKKRCRHKWPLPKYRILTQTGEAHEQWFKVLCDLGELMIESRARAAAAGLPNSRQRKSLLRLEQKLATGKKNA
jgi:ribonuclease-3